jgi:hypothetical protein
LQIQDVKPLGEPAGDRRSQLARGVPFALLPSQPTQAGHRSQFQRFGVLLVRCLVLPSRRSFLLYIGVVSENGI